METNSSESSIFATGFTLGLLSGVVGYYLFGTPHGRQMRGRLENEWQQAQSHLQQQGVVDEEISSLSAFWDQLKHKVLDALEVEPSATQPKKKRQYHKKQEPEQFSGI